MWADCRLRMASVTPRKMASGSTSWRVQCRVDGQPRQTSFANEKAAREFGALIDRVGGDAAYKVLTARQDSNVDTPTLRVYTERFLDAHSGLLTGIEPGTRAKYLRNANLSFLLTLGDMPIDAITKADVGRWVAWQETQKSKRSAGNVSAKTIRNYHGILSSIFSSAVEEKLVPANPAFKTRLTRGVAREAVFLSTTEFRTLLHFTDPRYRRLVNFLVGSGCRWGEATALTWRDINLDTVPATVRIDKAWKQGVTVPVLGIPKTSKARRTIALNKQQVEDLGTPGNGGDLVFGNVETGTFFKPGRFSTLVWLPAVRAATDPVRCAAAGLALLARPPRVHDLRHTHASWLIAANVPLPHIQVRLGHESVNTTVGIYGHLLNDSHAQMAEAMAQVMSSVLPIVGELEG
jgi:integrase